MALAFLAPSPVALDVSTATSTPISQAPPAAGAAGSSSMAAVIAGVAAMGLGIKSSSRAKLPSRQATAPLAIPVLPEPAYRQLKDPLLAECDVGFDPLNLAVAPSPFGTGEETYYNYREAEVKHGRLAMLATVGWLSSEELQASLAKKLGLVDVLAKGELAPSLVNGGLGNLPEWFLPAVFVLSGWIEILPQQQGNRSAKDWDKGYLKYKPQPGRLPGDLSWDPLSLKPTIIGTGTSLEKLHNAEVKHGRAAMLGIVGFVIQEFVTRVPVLDEDKFSADRLVATLDKGIDAVDKTLGLQIPGIPEPFPLSNIA